MYSYEWDESTGGYILNSTALIFSKEPRPVYYKELDILGFNEYWNYEKDDSKPYMWAESNTYIYRGKIIAKTIGGGLYTAPKLQTFEDEVPFGTKLQQIKIKEMVEKNTEIMDALVNETIRNIYLRYQEYKNKVDVFYVAFSGGKDSIVVLDLVQRALPHNSFKIVFGDTGMELPDTYLVRQEIKKLYPDIEFYTAKSDGDALTHWEQFGPPAHVMRWCCSVHKTSPQMILLREVLGNSKFKGLAFTGVRKDESVARSEYEDIGEGKKHNGQISYHAILEWGTAELFLYIYQRNLLINEAYKKGNSRVGCIVCPMSSGKHEYMKNINYPDEVEKFINSVRNTTNKNFESEAQMKQFIEYGGWKMRRSGRELNIASELMSEELGEKSYILHIYKYSEDWKMWAKTIGILIQESNEKYTLKYKNSEYKIILNVYGLNADFKLMMTTRTKDDIKFISLFKSVLIKSMYCIHCKECVAECQFGFIQMKDGRTFIDDECVKCAKCHNMSYGCLVYNSLRNPKGAITKMEKGSLERYLTFGFDKEWLRGYLKHQEDFWNSEENTLGIKMIPVCKKFLQDAGLTAEKGKGKNKERIFTKAGEVVKILGADNEMAWALMLVNLVCTPQFNWYVKNTAVGTTYIPDEIKLRLGESLSELQKRNFIDAFKNIFVKTPIGFELGLGDCDINIKNGKIFLNSITRSTWRSPSPEVILYSLYKFAEECGEYYQFTLSRLMNFQIESNGISPAQIFGLDDTTMRKILNGLSINYPEFISVGFTHDLDIISLVASKSSIDVLDLCLR